MARVPKGLTRRGVPAPTEFLRTRWKADPLARGSYSYMAKGATPNDRRVLAKPVENTVFFAGEAASSDYPETVHGALDSGRIAARQVLKTDAQTVAVIGAGVAGMAAAQKLAQAGRSVAVFEARNRVGGRVWTDRSLGVPLDLGGSWIHGPKGNPLTELADDLRLGRMETDYEDFAAKGPGGVEVDPDDMPRWIWDAFEIEQNYAVQRSQLSRHAFTEGADLGGEDVVFPGGYDQIFAALKADYAVVTGKEAKRISYVPGDVQVDFATGSERVQAVVVTVPLGVLKAGAIAFDPPLPKDKQRAIKRLGVGLLNKLYLKFERVFWDKDAMWLAYATPRRNPFPTWLNMAAITGAPVLMAFMGADAAIAQEKQSDVELIDSAMAVLDEMYG